ncbi:MAG: hypothetical protein IPM53_25335 [Anaerolineaceae bacterium]|nr:hypothetical protein [Anaerolineaceae bacterium]
MSSFLDKLGRNFLIATFIPSMGFIIIFIYLFSPILPFELKDSVAYLLAEEAISPTNQVWSTAAFIFVLTLLLGYTLHGLENFIYKALEGYYLFRSPRWRKRQQTKALKRLIHIKAVDTRLRELQESFLANQDDTEIEKKLDVFTQKSFNLRAQYRQDYPPQTQYIMPTRFGNILRAAEHYSEERYKMDSVSFWPRLIHVIEPDYYNQIDQSNNGLAFVVNSMVLSVTLAILCLFASAYQFTVWQAVIPQYNRQVESFVEKYQVDPTENDEQLFKDFTPLYFLELSVLPAAQREYKERGGGYFLGMFVFMGVAYFFYNASLPAAKQYGNMIRSAYDLFRFDLRKQLRLVMPHNSDEDYDSWEKWSEFVAIGNDAPRRFPFVFQYMPDEIRKSLRSEDDLYRDGGENEEGEARSDSSSN